MRAVGTSGERPRYVRGMLALVLGGAGVFFFGLTSPPAIVVGLAARRALPRPPDGRSVPGRAAATSGVAIGAVGLVLWATFLLRLVVRAERNGLDSARIAALLVALVGVWIAAGVAAWLALRSAKRRDVIVLGEADDG